MTGRPSEQPGQENQETGQVAAAVTAMRERARARNLARVEVIAKAVEALAQGRLDEEERAQAEGAAHSLAGSAGTFGFHEVTEPARALEQLLGAPAAATGEPEGRAPCSLAALRAALAADDDIPEQRDRS